jgi:hypothetical protein
MMFAADYTELKNAIKDGILILKSFAFFL